VKWIKFSENLPEKNKRILYCSCESAEYPIIINFNGMKNSHSSGYYCNNVNCHWIYDDCGCALEISLDDFWMPLPNRPERLSEKTSKEDAIV
jgi:Protein of unknown function (DUF551)